MTASSAARLVGLDLLKLCLALLVVTIHANPLREVSAEATWLLGNGLARVAVPGFFTVAGYMFRPEVPGRSRRLIGRYVWLHLLWLTLYLPFWWPSVAAGGVAQYLRMWIFGWWQLWFLTGLAVAVAGAALVWRWPARALWALALALFTLGYLLQIARMEHWVPREWWPLLVRNGVLLGLPFFLLGHLLRRSGLDRRIGFAAAFALGTAGLVLSVAETMALRHVADPAHPLAPETLIAALIACPALVIAAVRAPPLPAWLSAWPLGTLSAGIYFLHIGFVITLTRFYPLPRAEVYLIAVIGSALLTLALIRLRLAGRLF
ncbi:MAG: acyltransferase family protein [Paracoccaceae bacterium]|nr:acyltransferase family protein [Paracoccaceae bacterium]